RLGAALSARSLPFEPSEPAELVRNRPRAPILGRKLEQVARVTHLRWLLRPRVVPYSVRYPIEASEFLLGGSDWKQRLYGGPLKLDPNCQQDVVCDHDVVAAEGMTGALQQLVVDLVR